MKTILSFKYLLAFCMAFLLNVSCAKQEKQGSSTPTHVAPQNELCHPKLMSFTFGLEHLSIADQVLLLDSLALDGLIVHVPIGGSSVLRDYYQTTEVQNDSVNVFDVFVNVTIVDSVIKQSHLQMVESVLQEIQFEDTRLQVVFKGEDENPELAISELADLAANYGKDLIIYPHYKTSMESAEEALRAIKAVKKSNVFLSVHLCHELAAGNGNRIDSVISNVAPYIKSVSISGATESEQNDSTLGNWYWGIKPLSMGAYDYSAFYNALYQINYVGPVAIHTWRIFENFGLSPEVNLPVSKEIIDQLAFDACK